MRKLCFVLTALLLTAPSFAGVVLSCAQTATDSNVVQVSYVASDDANRPRAFGLDITLDNGALIGDIVSGSESSDYWVYPGTIIITSGVITDLGTPMAPGIDPGALGGPDTSGMTVEMGSLYNDPCDPEHSSPPALSGVLFQFTVYGATDCNVAISGNSARGNVVLEDTEQATDVTYGTCPVVLAGPCYTGPDTTEWALVGSPTSWCNERQCHGDADGLIHKEKGLVDFWVGVPDLQILISGWKKPDTDAGFSSFIAADFTHSPHNEKGIPYSFRVGVPDLQVLINYWKGPNGGKPAPPTDCLTSSPVSP